MVKTFILFCLNNSVLKSHQKMHLLLNINFSSIKKQGVFLIKITIKKIFH